MISTCNYIFSNVKFLQILLFAISLVTLSKKKTFLKYEVFYHLRTEIGIKNLEENGTN